ncbi:peroxide stress protein YaaA [Microbacterium sp. W1N]|uniref:YaaA family protein n=1 Tax=Microbacterium festucae TaxID=2977531 RepID=UPI0021C0EBCB|nr:peroxide stress protein YaaA [Microbacterium festucae]MCT9821593.1 peroxide stress protein YaaA [Microbacterium festucae]
MLILLPPSETKRPGGRGAPVDLDTLALPALSAQRHAVADALVALSADPDAAARVLKLSERQRGDIDANAQLRRSPTMPAVDRYTGVLFDALDAATLAPAARRWLGAHVLVQSAPFGPVGALDGIPAYRLAAGTALPGLPSLRRTWADAVTAALAATDAPFVLDLRSEAYAALGPVPAGLPSRYVRVVADSGAGDGAVRALNHFNKHAKGALVRELALARPRIRSAAGFARWAEQAGLRVREGVAGELELFA